jgi:hypothetical protein
MFRDTNLWYVCKVPCVFVFYSDSWFVFLQAIAGARLMFSVSPPQFIYMEYSPQRYATLGLDGDAMLRYLIDIGYRIWFSYGYVCMLVCAQL